MSAVALPTIATRTAVKESAIRSAWLEDRKTYLGATDISAILKCNPYRTPHDVWLDKLGKSEDVSTLAMRAGIHMEVLIAKEFQNRTGFKVRTSKTYRDREFPFLACNPDREFVFKAGSISVPALLECKRVGNWASQNFGQDGSDQVPAHYMIQVLWQMVMTGRELVFLAALIDDRELRLFPYSLNPELSKFAHIFPASDVVKIRRHAVAWWNRHIVGGEEPELTGGESDLEWVMRERETYDNGKLVNADEALDEVCKRLGTLLPRKAAVDKAVDECKNQIRAFMAVNEASALETKSGTFTWRTDARGIASLRTPFKSSKA